MSWRRTRPYWYPQVTGDDGGQGGARPRGCTFFCFGGPTNTSFLPLPHTHMKAASFAPLAATTVDAASAPKLSAARPLPPWTTWFPAASALSQQRVLWSQPHEHWRTDEGGTN
jgi:hypothetical protein